jgi:hypothetical protein
MIRSGVQLEVQVIAAHLATTAVRLPLAVPVDMNLKFKLQVHDTLTTTGAGMMTCSYAGESSLHDHGCNLNSAWQAVHLQVQLELQQRRDSETPGLPVCPKYSPYRDACQWSVPKVSRVPVYSPELKHLLGGSWCIILQPEHWRSLLVAS